MTGAEFAERLVGAGLDPVEGPAKTRLFDLTIAGLAAAGAGAASHAWWIPGRLELFGKHTDYAGGRTLVAAVPRGFAFVATPRRDDTIIVVDAANGERVSLGHEGAPFSGWRHYVDVVGTRLLRNFPGAAGGVTIAFASDLPRASGMSSSSALVVGVATALTERWGLTAHAEWLRNIRDPCDLAAYLACVENGSAFGTLAGDAGVGTHGGSEDHVAILHGRAGCFSAYAFAPVRHLQDVRVPGDWSVVIGSSGVSAEKTGEAQGAYNHLSEAARVLLRIWNEQEPPADSLAAALASSPLAPDRLTDLVAQSTVAGWSADSLHRRLAHFQAEDACVEAAVRAVDQADAAAIGEISRMSQQNAERLLRTQVPQTSALVEQARSCGAFAACSFGAGFGGSVWALVERKGEDGFATEWLARYRRRYSAPGAVSFVAAPGPPVIEIHSAR